jgi:ATP-binding cassette, subfamily B, multidrug efflux pump
LPRAKPETTNFQLLVRMLGFLKPVKWTVIICALLIIFWIILDTNITNTNRLIINHIQDHFGSQAAAGAFDTSAGFWQSFRHGPLREVLRLIIIVGAMVVANCLGQYFRWVMNMKFTMDMVYHMRSAVYDRLQRVGFSFHDHHSSGQLINRALSDLQNVRTFLQSALVSIIEIVCFVIGFNILIFIISPTLAAVAFLPIPFWIWYIMRYSKKMQPAQRKQMTAADDLVTVFTENVAGVHVVKAFATQPTEVRKYNTSADGFFDTVMKTVMLQRNFTPTVRGIASASHLALFAVGAMFVVRKRLDVGDLLAFGTAMGQILGRLQQITMISDQYQKAIVSARRFYEILDAPDTVPENPVAQALPAVRGGGSVEFNFVTFGYAPEKPVVKDITFEIDPGSVVALVGPTASGKSTIVQLMARFYDPQNGHVLIDGVDIKNVQLSSLRKQIGFVFQETFLFSDTVANNIRYGNPDATLGEVEAAARIAQAHEFINELPRGYDTMLGERGASLSGGQRQRLAIARAIVSNPRILVLDDALAAVDPETEHLISRALELVMVDRTVFIIAHRLSTVKAADVVMVLENGRITQAGTHKELMREAGHYRHIAEVQLAYQEKEIVAEAQKKKDILDASHHGMPAQQ